MENREQLNTLLQSELEIDLEYLESILKQLEDGRVGDITLTEQFNTWFIQGLAEWANQIEKYFSENMAKPIEDIREINPDAIVEDIVVTEKVTDNT